MSECSCCATMQLPAGTIITMCDASIASIEQFRKGYDDAWLERLATELTALSKRRRWLIFPPKPKNWTRDEAKAWAAANSFGPYGFRRWFSYPSNHFAQDVTRCARLRQMARITTVDAPVTVTPDDIYAMTVVTTKPKVSSVLDS